MCEQSVRVLQEAPRKPLVKIIWNPLGPSWGEGGGLSEVSLLDFHDGSTRIRLSNMPNFDLGNTSNHINLLKLNYCS